LTFTAAGLIFREKEKERKMPYEYARVFRMNDLNTAPDTETEDELLADGYKIHSEQTIPAADSGSKVITLTLYERFVAEEVVEPPPMRIR